MVSIDEDNYKEAIEAAFKVFAPRGISELTISCGVVTPSWLVDY